MSVMYPTLKTILLKFFRFPANSYKTILLSVLLSTLVSTNVFAQDEKIRLPKTGNVARVAVRSHSGVEAAIKKWSATIDYLSHSVDGYTFQMVPLLTFEEMRNVVKNNEVEFVLTNPTAYIDLSVKYKVSRIATLINGRDKNGHTEFGGVVFTKADRDDINLLSDVKGKSIMGVHKEAFGGWRMAYRELLEIGINPFDDCSEVLFSPGGTQQEIAYNVLQGKVDIGTVRTGILENLEKKGEIDLRNIKVIEPKADNFPLPHTTRLYPEWPFSVTENTDEQLARKVSIALLQMEKENPAAENGGYTGWKVPLSYNQVLLLLKGLKISPFEDYGKITTAEYLKQNWLWFLLVCIAVLGLFLIILFVIKINRKLNIRTAELEEARDGLDQKVKEQTAELVIEIEERKRAEEKLNKSNRLYATLSQLNQAIVRERDKQKLFQEICNIAVEFGKFRLAWIGLVDEGNKLVNPVAFSGEGSDYLQNITISLNNDVSGKGPTSRSIREGKSIVFNDLENNPDFLPWIKQALEKKYRSSAAFPLRLNNDVIGAFNVYAVEPFFFDKDETNLLEEAAMDISFALEKFEQEDNRRQTEKKLAESEEKFRILYNNSPDMYVSVSADDASILFCNETLLNKTGYSREEIIGAPVFKMYHEDCLDEVEKTFQQFVGTGVIQDKKLIIKRKDGSKIDVSLNVEAIRDETGKILYSISSWRDITERKRTERALKVSEGRLGTLLSNLPGMAYQCKNDENWTMLFVNDACEQLTGYKPEQLVYNRDISYYELIHPDDRVFVSRQVKDALNAGKHFELEYRIISADGKEKWVWERGVQTTSPDYSSKLLEGVIHDVTNRKQAEEALKRSKERLVTSNKELQLHMDKIIAIHRAGQRLQMLKNPETLAQEIITVLEEILKYKYGAVLLIDESDGKLLPFAISDQGKGQTFLQSDKAYIASQNIKPGTGIVGWVAQYGESVRLGDIRQDPRYFPMRNDIRSELCVPLKVNEKNIGVVNIETSKINAYTETDQLVLETIASQIAIAIQNSSMYKQIKEYSLELEQNITERRQAEKEIERNYKEQTTLLRVSQKLVGQIDLENLLQKIPTFLVETISEAEAASVWLYDEDQDVVTPTAWIGHDDMEMAGLTVSSDTSLVGLICRTGTTRNIIDTSSESSFEPLGKPVLDAVKSVVGVPLIAENKLFGVIFADNLSMTHAFDDNAVRLLQSLSNQLALAIKNARLYEARIKSENILRESREQLRTLASHLQSVREEERTAIAREIHDELGQILTVLKMDLSLMGRDLSEETGAPNTAALLDEIKSMTGLIDKTIQQVRKLITELRPEVLDNLGLIAALEWQNQEFQSHSKIKCKFETSVENIDISSERAIAIFRIFQEALTNIMRHAQASLATVNIYEKDNNIFLNITDNGIGIDTDLKGNKNTFGLLGMQERATIFGGEVIVESSMGKGTSITVRIPVKSE
jgi:PAS domain S-box-containing protein